MSKHAPLRGVSASGIGCTMPTEDHAGVYSATLAYLNAVKKAGSVVRDRVVQTM